MKSVLLAGVASLVAVVPGIAAAECPEKPVGFYVPWPRDDPENVLTPEIADDFQTTCGVPTAVVNKRCGGGGPVPGAVEIAKSPADGDTVGSFMLAVPVIGPDIDIPELNPNRFGPLGVFLTCPFVIVAAEVRQQIIAMARETMTQDRARAYMAEAAASVFRQDAPVGILSTCDITMRGGPDGSPFAR